MEMWAGPFEELPPLAVEHECRHGRVPFCSDAPCGCFPQETVSVRAAGTMES